MVLSLTCPRAGAPTQPPPSKGYVCVGAQCVGTNVTGGGMPLVECENTCLKPGKKYMCVAGVCVESVNPNRGANKSTCLEICLKQPIETL